MRCEETRELLADYWELPEDDWNRLRVNEHMKNCADCRAEFELWRESFELIRTAAEQPNESLPLPRSTEMSASVMERIYADEGWRLPVAERIYSIPHRLRLRLLSLVAGCLAMFFCGFLYQLIAPQAEPSFTPSSGMMAVSALGGNESAAFSIAGIEGVPVASIGEPIVLGLAMVESYPNYLFALSMLGLICALLTLNWLARIRA